MAMIVVLMVFVPAASASEGENPSFSIPDPQTVTTGAQDLTQSRVDDANTTASENAQEAADTVSTVNESVMNGNPEVPLENLDATGERSLGLADRSITDAYYFASDVEGWLFDEIAVKLEEGDFLGNRSHISVQKHGSSAIGLAQTALLVACRDSVAGGSGPTDCEDASLVGQTVASGSDIAATASAVATNQKDNAVDSAAHLAAEAENLICGGPCQ